MSADDQNWSKPAAMAIPKEGYFELERGRYGPTYPRTPACYGFSIIAKVKEGREEAVRAYGKTIEETIAASPATNTTRSAALRTARSTSRSRSGRSVRCTREYRRSPLSQVAHISSCPA
jgi:hypothetical protein